MTSASSEGPRFHPLWLDPTLRVEAEGFRAEGVGGAPRVLEGGTAWVMCTMGTLHLSWAGEWALRPGMFAVLPAGAVVGGEGFGLAVIRRAYEGLFQVGGPVERVGRLRYIDGCTDTLLTCPPRWGEPCLNHLHIPAATLQTTHTHPSDRVGVITRGRGRCWTPAGSTPLRPGMGWWIPAGLPHHFETDDEPLDVLAWHPDSDFGPTDEVHPMINRTIR